MQQQQQQEQQPHQDNEHSQQAPLHGERKASIPSAHAPICFSTDLDYDVAPLDALHVVLISSSLVMLEILRIFNR
jgi:hypothetical protein